MACFAANELTKHGWSAGKGLGKKEHGIKEAIKVKRKNNTSGLGLDIAEQFTYHWWDHAFNKAAKSISVDTTGDEVKLSKTESIEPLSTKKVTKYFNGKPLMYGTFVKSGSYIPGSENENKEEREQSSSSEDEVDHSCKDTLERTYKITGLTGHKAARHGHRMSGKLKRILDQEECSPICTPSASPEHNIDSDTTEPVPKKKKKKRRNVEMSNVSEEKEDIAVSDSSETTKQKKKKKNMEVSNVDEEKEDVSISDTNVTTKKKNKKKNREVPNVEEEKELLTVSGTTETSKKEKKKKKKKKERTDDLVQDSEEVSSECQHNAVEVKLKSKRKSKK